MEYLSKEIGNLIAGALDEVFGDENVSFALLLLRSNSLGPITYVSNVETRDLIHAIREMASTLQLKLHTEGQKGGKR
jgi:hypothetical protein